MANKKLAFSAKRLELDKTNTQMVIVVSIASFISIFSLITAYGFLGQNNYNARVIDAKAKTNDQLVANIEAAQGLANSYNTFVRANPNILGGGRSDEADNGGDNARIVLDALPSSYNFPALTSSIEKLLEQYTLVNLTGTDDELAQKENVSSPNPEAVPMPFTFSVNNANYTSIQQLVDRLQKSIRPIQVDSLTLSGGADNMQIVVNAHTYYQPEKNLNITKQVVK